MIDIQTRDAYVRDANLDRAMRMVQVNTKIASTICKQTVEVSLASASLAPAWSDSEHIWFSKAYLPDLQTAEGVIESKGLLLHEIGHILFTPRNGSPLASWCKVQRHLWSSFNCLEDMRLETLLVAKYRSAVASWLTAMSLRFLLADPTNIDTQFPLIHGRKYLPVQVRQSVQDAYHRPETVAELASVIDAYRKLNVHTEFDTAKFLIQRYYELVFSPRTEPEPEGEGQGEGQGEGGAQGEGIGQGKGGKSFKKPQGGCSKGGNFISSNYAPSQHSPVETGESLLDQIDAGNNGGETDVEPSDGSESGNGEPSDGDIEPSDSGSMGDELSDSIQDELPETDSKGNNGKGIGNERSGSTVIESISDALAEVTGSLAGDIKRTMAQYSGEIDLEGNGIEIVPSKFQQDTPPVGSGRAIVAFAEELKRIKAECEPNWERKTRSGRFNTRRYIAQEQGNSVDVRTLFDRWSKNQDDATNIETVILLDNSGSMEGVNADRAYTSMWQVKSALDSLPETQTTVVVFNNDAHLLYSGEERADGFIRNAGTRGGTDPKDAIEYATEVLARSTKPVRLLLTITDGAWGNSETCDKAVSRLRDAGVVTGLAYIGAKSSNDVDAHGSEVVTAINNTSDLLVFGRLLVNLAIQRNLR